MGKRPCPRVCVAPHSKQHVKHGWYKCWTLNQYSTMVFFYFVGDKIHKSIFMEVITRWCFLSNSQIWITKIEIIGSCLKWLEITVGPISLHSPLRFTPTRASEEVMSYYHCNFLSMFTCTVLLKNIGISIRPKQLTLSEYFFINNTSIVRAKYFSLKSKFMKFCTKK